MIRYLLGELTEQERTALEDKYFSDSDTFNELARVETQLIDNYVRRNLTPDVQQRFENVYLRDQQRRERVKFAEILVAKVDSPRAVEDSNKLSWWQALFAPFTVNRLTAGLSVAALILLVVASVSLFVQNRRVRNELQQAQAGNSTREQRQRELQELVVQEQDRSRRLTDELNQARSEQVTKNGETAAGPTFVSLVIALSSTRGPNTGPPTTLVVPRGTKEVRLQLRLNDLSYSTYNVKIETAAGGEVFTQSGLKSRATNGRAVLSVNAPASKFASGDYLLTLQGRTDAEFEVVSQSLFRVEKREGQ